MSWFKSKSYPINPALFNTASPEKIAEVEAKVDAKLQAHMVAYRRAEELADKHICPSCAHHPIEQACFHYQLGMNSYRCPACGWEGDGAMVI